MEVLLKLLPIDGRKSFYGKGKARIVNDTEIECISYNTVVCKYDVDSELFTRLWNNYSATTMRHIQSFCSFHGLPLLNKADWCSLPIGQAVQL